MKINEFESMLITNKPVKCKCGGKYFHVGGGQYKCSACNEIVLDDFGKVKQILDTNGPMPVATISLMTGVSTDVINFLLKNGRVEIVEGSKYYLHCSKCGCSIKSGRFCFDCAKQFSEGLQDIFYNEIGDKPKYEIRQTGKMHFLNRK